MKTSEIVKTHQILRNGKVIKDTEGTLGEVIGRIRFLESFLDRLKEHSPYTIGLIEDTD